MQLNSCQLITRCQTAGTTAVQDGTTAGRSRRYHGRSKRTEIDAERRPIILSTARTPGASDVDETLDGMRHDSPHEVHTPICILLHQALEGAHARLSWTYGLLTCDSYLPKGRTQGLSLHVHRQFAASIYALTVWPLHCHP